MRKRRTPGTKATPADKLEICQRIGLDPRLLPLAEKSLQDVLKDFPDIEYIDTKEAWEDVLTPYATPGTRQYMLAQTALRAFRLLEAITPTIQPN